MTEARNATAPLTDDWMMLAKLIDEARQISDRKLVAATELADAQVTRIKSAQRLIEQWRGSAAACLNRAEADRPWGDEDRSRASVYIRCAEELVEALSVNTATTSIPGEARPHNLTMGRTSVGWHPRCSCGWRGDVYGTPEDYQDRGVQEWETHRRASGLVLADERSGT